MQVDFRYSDACLMLMLDGHVESQTHFVHAIDGTGEDEDWDDLERDRNVRIVNLTDRWMKVIREDP